MEITVFLARACNILTCSRRRTLAVKRLTDSKEILQRWAEHFNNLLNQSCHVDENAIDEFPQWQLQEELSILPSLDETKKALKHMANGKVPGPDSIPAEMYKFGGQRLVRGLVHFFTSIWEKEFVPKEFKDANIVYMYKRKGKPCKL